jgi:acetolactate synthase regulatory subunit
VGAVTSRIEAQRDAFLANPALLQAVTGVVARSGLLALVMRVNKSATLTARAEDEQITVDADESTLVVASVHQLLDRAGIFVSSEKAGL